MGDAANDLEEHGMVRTLKDLFAGAAGGIAQVLLGEYFFRMSFIVAQSPLLQLLNLISRAFRSCLDLLSQIIFPSIVHQLALNPALLTHGRPAIRYREGPFADNNSIL